MSVVQFPNSIYGFTSPLTTTTQPPIVSLRTPTTSDFAALGTIWIYKTGNQAYIITSIVSNSASWLLLESGGSGGSFTTLTSTGATTLATTGASVNTFGNTTGTTSVGILAGSGGINLTGATTVTGTLTSTGATTLATTGASTNTLGNTTGATSLGLLVGTGNFTLTGVAGSTVTIGTGITTGAITIGAAQTTGTFNIGGTAGATGNITIGGGTGAQQIAIGNNATGNKTIAIGNGGGVNTITIGSTAGASALDLNAGSDGVLVTSPSTSFTGQLEASTLYATSDAGGVASTTSLTNANVAVSTGTGHFVTLATTGAGTTSSAGFLKLYLGTVAIYVPYWTQTT